MKRIVLLLLLGMMGGATPAEGATVSYRLAMPRPWTHLFEVEMVLRGLEPADSVLDLQMPVWRTGRYVIFDFAGGVEQFSASGRAGTGTDEALPFEKIDKSTWRIRVGRAREVTVRYTVYADEFAQRTRGLNDEHGFVDGASVFMYLQKYRTTPLTLTVVPYGNWHVTTGLDALPGERFRFEARGYDHLADCPLEIGTQVDHPFTVDGIPHLLSLSGPSNLQLDSLAAYVQQIIRMNAAFWGGLPYKRYVFLIHAMPEGGGGTEHLNSCVLDIAPSFSRQPDHGRGLVGLFSHEFLHTWNVKRLRPRGMDPYDWTRENYYRELWLAEGGTSYLHGLLLMRNGLSSPRGFVEGIHSQVEADRQRPGNLVQSPAACSFDAWIKFSRNLPQAYNFETDIYARGAHVCMLLDLEMRWRSGNRASFDLLMQTLYRRFPLGSGGYTVEDVERIAGELAGRPMADFFARYVHGAAALAWEQGLEHAGLRLQPADTLARSWLGIAAAEDQGRTIVHRVVAGSPAYEAGINTGDELVAVNGIRTRSAELFGRIADLAVGDPVRLTVFRRDQLREFSIRLGRLPVPPYVVTRLERPTPLQRQIFESWLGISWDRY